MWWPALKLAWIFTYVMTHSGVTKKCDNGAVALLAASSKAAAIHHIHIRGHFFL